MNAVLVVDMPKSCYKCPMKFDDGNGIWCGVERDKNGDMHMRVHYYCDENGKPSWCPLSPLPIRIKADSDYLGKGLPEDYRVGYAEGWNDCIEEIEKGY